jgi:hypothetical protein
MLIRKLEMQNKINMGFFNNDKLNPEFDSVCLVLVSFLLSSFFSCTNGIGIDLKLIAKASFAKVKLFV